MFCPGSSTHPALRVEPVAQAVSHHVEAEHGDHDGEAGKHHHPGRLEHEPAAVSGRTPTPRNDSEASTRMAMAIRTEAWTKMGVTAFGRMWPRMRRDPVAPSARAPST